jgi:hypothetical protein
MHQRQLTLGVMAGTIEPRGNRRLMTLSFPLQGKLARKQQMSSVVEMQCAGLRQSWAIAEPRVLFPNALVKTKIPNVATLTVVPILPIAIWVSIAYFLCYLDISTSRKKLFIVM